MAAQAAPPQQYEAAPEPAPAASPAEAPYERLKKRAALHAAGVLPDEVFAAEMAKILGDACAVEESGGHGLPGFVCARAPARAIPRSDRTAVRHPCGSRLLNLVSFGG